MEEVADLDLMVSIGFDFLSGLRENMRTKDPRR
jgi:hypothetical protein